MPRTYYKSKYKSILKKEINSQIHTLVKPILIIITRYEYGPSNLVITFRNAV